MKRVQDHYFQKAKREGYAARAAYKLGEIDRKRRLLKSGQKVLDLGCAPGSWLQVAAQRVGPRGRVVGIDLEPVNAPLPDHVRTIRGDIAETSAQVLLAGFPAIPRGGPGDGGGSGGAGDPGKSGEPESGARFDLVLSDMAPRTSGVPAADAARSVALVEQALDLAAGVLRPGGALLAKVFQGGDFPRLRQRFRECFDQVTVEKPKASRPESVEIFLLGRGFHPPHGEEPDDQGSGSGN